MAHEIDMTTGRASFAYTGQAPGLRAVSFTLTGTPEHCAKGLQAWADSSPT